MGGVLLGLRDIYTTGAIFDDVGVDDFAAAWIEQLFLQGITAGCGDRRYCPQQVLSKAQLARLLVLAKYGSGLVPPPATGLVFDDVAAADAAAASIELLANDGITAGCEATRYCPREVVTQAALARLFARTFDL